MNVNVFHGNKAVAVSERDGQTVQASLLCAAQGYNDYSVVSFVKLDEKKWHNGRLLNSHYLCLVNSIKHAKSGHQHFSTSHDSHIFAVFVLLAINSSARVDI